ncbi:hypothetical protein FJ364_05365, partial [Candidatus Dependentiae bacterium]|nr:hypothetical protein [Candidatus Dependentiae bacterium]
MLIRFINISFLSIFFLFGFFQNTHAQKNDTAIQSNNIANQIAVEQALTKNFVMYLKNITKVLHVDRSNVTPVMLKHVLRVEELFTRIERGFAQGAFASNPLIKKRFEILFTTIDATSWPTPAMIRKWQKDLD